MTVQRRAVLKGMLAGSVGLAAGLQAPAVRAQARAVRVGLLTVKTGPLAQGGLQMEQGIATFLKEKSNTLADRKIELSSFDTGGTPAGALSKAREFVEKDHVDVILGPLAAFELLAITNYVRERQVPVITLAAAEDVTQRAANPWVVRPSASSAQTPHAMADYCAKELKLKRMATLANDFAYGHEQCAGFQRVFEDAGGKIIKKVWPPLNTPDYLPYLSQLGDAEGVFNGLGGSIPVRALRTFADLGLDRKMTTAGGWTLMDDTLLKSMGDEAIEVIRRIGTRPITIPPATSGSWPICERATTSRPAAMRPECMSPGRSWRPSCRRSAQPTTRQRSGTRCATFHSPIRHAVPCNSIGTATRSARSSSAGASARTAGLSTRWSRPIRM